MLIFIFFSEEFNFDKITVLDLNPDTNITKDVMFSGSSYPFGLDPVNIDC
jgi:hypothetical protein